MNDHDWRACIAYFANARASLDRLGAVHQDSRTRYRNSAPDRSAPHQTAQIADMFHCFARIARFELEYLGIRGATNNFCTEFFLVPPEVGIDFQSGQLLTALPTNFPLLYSEILLSQSPAHAMKQSGVTLSKYDVGKHGDSHALSRSRCRFLIKSRNGEHGLVAQACRNLPR